MPALERLACDFLVEVTTMGSAVLFVLLSVILMHRVTTWRGYALVSSRNT
jgi:hypothetical protein